MQKKLLYGCAVILLIGVSQIANALPKGVALGTQHSCALTYPNSAKCWGNNTNGQLGNATSGTAVNSTPTLVKLPSSSYIDMAAGNLHTCVVEKKGTIKCWGHGGLGQLGLGVGKKPMAQTTPADVTTITNAISVVAGDYHTCALLTTRTVKCWGYNAYGQLGNNSKTTSYAPVDVAGLNNVIDITAGQYHTCAIVQGGAIKCWGVNTVGQLGNGSKTPSMTPVTVSNTTGKGAIAIEAGSNQTCAILDNYSVQCWGYNNSGQLGATGSIAHPTPTVMTGLKNISDLALGSDFMCALDNIGVVRCIGGNYYGQLGIGSSGGKVTTPTVVNGLGTVSTIVARAHHVCATSNTYTLKCWGRNTNGQLAIDPQPTKIGFLNKPSAIVSGVSLEQSANMAKVNVNLCKNFVPPTTSPGQCMQYGCDQTTGGAKTFTAPKGQSCNDGNPFTTGETCSWGSCQGGVALGTATTQYWQQQKPAIEQGMNALLGAATAFAQAKTAFGNDIAAAMEPNIDALLKTGALPPNVTPKVVASKATFDTAFQNIRTSLGKVTTITSTAMKMDGDAAQTLVLRQAIQRASIVYFNALFASLAKRIVIDPAPATCNMDPVGDQLLYQYSLNVTYETAGNNATVMDANAQNTLKKIITMIHCLPQSRVNLMDQTLTTAFFHTVAMVNTTHPSYEKGVQDYLLRIFAPVFINIYEVTRFQGNYVPTRSLIQLLADRMALIKDNVMPVMPDTGVYLQPSTFALFNPATQQPESIAVGCVGALADYGSQGCLVFRSFVHALADPTMDNYGTCSFWDTLRVGKACVSPPPQVGWLERVGRIIENFLIPSAYAEPPDGHAGKYLPINYPPKCNYKADDWEPQWRDNICGVCDKVCMPIVQYRASLTGDDAKYACNIELGGVYIGWNELALYNSFKIEYFNKLKTTDQECQKNPSLIKWKCPSSAKIQTKPATMAQIYTSVIKTCQQNPPPDPDPTPVCGNIITEGTEQCDDGNENNDDECNSSCQKTSCVNKCQTNLYITNTACAAEKFAHTAMVAELNAYNKKNGTKTTLMNFIYTNKCGLPNDVVDAKGNILYKAGDNCLALFDEWDKKCVPLLDACSSSCPEEKDPVCGSGIVGGAEQCDDGNTKDGDGCSSTCQDEKKCKSKCMDLNPLCAIAETMRDKGKQDSNLRQSNVQNTPWDGLGCKYTPYKAGTKFWIAQNILNTECWHDPAVQKCLDTCPAILEPLPIEKPANFECNDYQITKQPTWENGFGTPKDNPPISPLIKTAFIDQGIPLFETKWKAISDVLEGVLGMSLSGTDKLQAMNFGSQILSQAHECAGADLTYVQTIDPKTGSYAAMAISTSEPYRICWNPDYINKETFITDAQHTGAHEATHIAFMYLQEKYPDAFLASIGDDTSSYTAQCGFNSFMTDNSPGWLEHWIMDNVSWIGIPSSGAGTELKNVMCNSNPFGDTENMPTGL